MANNIIQMFRTTVSGRTPNTTNSSNTQYINIGQLALNLPDNKLFSSDGTNLFEIGSNNINKNVTNSFSFNSLLNINTTAIMVNSAIFLAGSNGINGQVLTSNGTSNAYWSSVGAGSTNVNATFAWTNTQSFSDIITFNGLILANTANAISYTTGDGTLTSTGGVVVNNSQIRVGNSTVNAYINSTSVFVSNLIISNTININRNSMTIGNSTVNSTINATGFYINSAPVSSIGISYTTSIGFNLI